MRSSSRIYWMGTVIAALVVGVIVYGLFFVCATVFRKKTDTELPRQFGYNMPLELVLTVIPIVIVGVLFYHRHHREQIPQPGAQSSR